MANCTGTCKQRKYKFALDSLSDADIRIDEQPPLAGQPIIGTTQELRDRAREEIKKEMERLKKYNDITTCPEGCFCRISGKEAKKDREDDNWSADWVEMEIPVQFTIGGTVWKAYGKVKNKSITVYGECEARKFELYNA